MVSGSPAVGMHDVATVSPSEVTSVLRRAGGLVASGHRWDAIELLADFNRRHRHVEIARQMVSLRHDAYGDLTHEDVRAEWPPVYEDDFADLEPGCLPEINGAQLSARTLGAGILHHGSLLVRNLVPEAATASLVADIDCALDGAQAWLSGAPPDETAPWFEIFMPSPPFTVGLSRQFVVQGGGVLAADSPLAMCAVIDLLDDAGIREVLTEYLGERPALSAKKTTLRRVPVDSGSDWHQDGAFLGRDVRSVNVWLALSPCGVDAPGLDVVPRRLDLVDAGSEGAIFNWSVGRPVVERVAGRHGTVRPVFRTGDALLFDDRNLHATACTPQMSAPRYALESWFFAPSHYPSDQVPVVF